MEVSRNLALRLTAPGSAALAVVRLQGPGAEALVQTHFSRPTTIGRATHGRWRDETGEVLDDPLILRDETGFDINLHGGPALVNRFLRQAQAAGFEVVGSEAAIDLLARDDVERWLPRATTEAGVRMLLNQPMAWASFNHAVVDFQPILKDQTLYRLLNPPTVALVGAANVGKSTLANRLFNEMRSLVADRPGTTRDWVGGSASVGGLPVTLVDTPGRRISEDAIEQAAIALSEAPVRSADAVVLVIDATRPEDVPEGFEGAIRIANKIDLAPPPRDAIPICAVAGTGFDRLVQALHEQLAVDLTTLDRPCWWTQSQREALASGDAGWASHLG